MDLDITEAPLCREVLEGMVIDFLRYVHAKDRFTLQGGMPFYALFLSMLVVGYFDSYSREVSCRGELRLALESLRNKKFVTYDGNGLPLEETRIELSDHDACHFEVVH